jgi:hypothetical protein
LPKIREAYRRKEIDTETVPHITMARRSRRIGYAVCRSKPARAGGLPIEAMAVRGQSISTKVPPFVIEDYAGGQQGAGVIGGMGPAICEPLLQMQSLSDCAHHRPF